MYSKMSKKPAALFCHWNTAETLIKQADSHMSRKTAMSRKLQILWLLENHQKPLATVTFPHLNITRILAVEWMLPWRLLGISWTPLKTIGNPYVSRAQP